MSSNREKNVNALFEAALSVQQKFGENQWKFCFIGGLAVLRWGEMRMTQDIDLCLLCGFGAEESYISTLTKNFNSRIPNAEEFAVRNRVLLLYALNGVPIDISLSGIPFEEQMISRATFFEFEPNYSLLTCSAEDLIVLKAFADRSKDWMDIEGILLRQRQKIDRSYILANLNPLCELKESSEIIQKLRKLFDTT
jgi:hypothetical protein